MFHLLQEQCRRIMQKFKTAERLAFLTRGCYDEVSITAPDGHTASEAKRHPKSVWTSTLQQLEWTQVSRQHYFLSLGWKSVKAYSYCGTFVSTF